jgi:Ca2+-binding RTX toxin-like protein
VETLVNTTTADSQINPVITALAGGGHVVIWTSYLQDGAYYGIYSQRYAADGSAVGVETRVNTTTADNQAQASVAGLADGGYVVTWTSTNQDGSSDGVYSQRYAADGSAAGVETRINITTSGAQANSQVAALDDGGYLVTWTSPGQDTYPDVFAQRYDANGNPVASGSALQSVGAGTVHFEGAQAVHLMGGATADSLIGGAGADTLDGGAGADTLAGGAGNDSMKGGDGADALKGDAGNDTLLGGNDADTLTGGMGNDSLQGDAGDDSLCGDAGNDSMQGGDGADTLAGGAGNDTLKGDAGDDTAVVADAQSAMTWTFTATQASISTPQGGIDQLTSIEHVQTANGVVDLTFSAPFDTRVNTYTQIDQEACQIATLADGGYVIAWESAGQDGSLRGIYAQRYAADGSAVGAETRINTTTLNDQASVAVAGLADGGYMVTWTSDGQDGSALGIYAQRYAADGSAVGVETRINTTTASYQASPSVTGLADGSYVFTWSSYGTGVEIYSQRYAADGSKMGGETLVDSSAASIFRGKPAIAATGDGGYLIAWESFNQDGSGYGIYAQRYAADGSKVGSETRINTTTAGSQHDVAIATLASGGYVITWASPDGSNDGVYAQRFAADGSALGGETRINTTTADLQQAPAIAAMPDGGYIITWHSYNQDGSSYGIYAQRYDQNGVAVGVETRVNATTTSYQMAPAIAAQPDGGFVISWESPDAWGAGIYLQHIDARGFRVGHPTLTGGVEDNVLRIGSAAESVEINGGAGNDTIAGSSYNDFLAGGSGADTFEFAASGNGVDHITDLANGDRITIAGASFAADAVAGDGTSVGQNQVQASTANGVTTLFIGTNSTPGADVVIKLDGTWTADKFHAWGNEIWMGTLTVVGGTGSDTVQGTNQPDVLTGGGGADTFEFAASNNGVDTITDFGADDLIVVDGASFGIATAVAGDGTTVGLNQIQSSTSGGITTLYIGTDSAPGADVVIQLQGTWSPDKLWTEGNQIWIGSPGISVTGSGGNDNLVGGNGIDTLNGGVGRDTMGGGLRGDIYYVDNPNDTIVEASNGGVDQVFSIVSYALGANVENITLIGSVAINATGNSQGNVIVGNGLANNITGGLGADSMTGGAGADHYFFNSAGESSAAPGSWDIILDFGAGDIIDLAKVDANDALKGNQAFTFIGTAAFSGNATAQLRFDSATHMLYGSTNADANPELAIELSGVVTLNVSSIVL